ncbi:MAG: hypothetical protein R3236_01750 [Phycisphaeraceae bacterium]|nr:hypothetical protein [Phycisphaeraceae bacterium]
MTCRLIVSILTAGLLIGCSSPSGEKSARSNSSLKERMIYKTYGQADTGLLRGPYAWSEQRWQEHLGESRTEFVHIAETTSLRTASLDAQTVLERHEIPSRLTVVGRHRIQLHVPRSKSAQALRIIERDAILRNYWMIRP